MFIRTHLKHIYTAFCNFIQINILKYILSYRNIKF